MGTNDAETWRTPIPELGAALLRLILGAWADEEIGPFLRAVLLTAAHERSTREKLRLVVVRSLIGVSQLGADDDDLVSAIAPNLQHYIEGDLGEN